MSADMSDHTMYAVLDEQHWLIEKNNLNGEFAYLWAATETQRKQALGTPFVQGVKDGSLDPTVFGDYVVQDCIYLYRQWISIRTAENRANNPKLKQFLNDTADKYKGYYEAAFQRWHIDNPSGIKLGSACQAYVDYADEIAETMDTIYFLVAMGPCLKLWSWLGTKIGTNHGAYDEWVKNNFKSGSTLKKITAFIDNENLDRARVLEVFKTCMGHEYSFFNSAGQY